MWKDSYNTELLVEEQSPLGWRLGPLLTGKTKHISRTGNILREQIKKGSARGGGLSPLPGPCVHGCQRQVGTPDVLDPRSSSSGTESSLREGDGLEREALCMSVMKIKRKTQLKMDFQFALVVERA